MAKDFRASQVETSKLIASGGLTNNVGLAIYSGSVASDRAGGITDSAIFNNVGTDVFLFVSGTISNSDFNRTEATLFGGDVVISGTLYAERQVIEVDSVADGNFFVTGNMYVKPDAGADSTTAVAFRSSSGENIFRVDSANKRVGIGTKSGDTTIDALLDIQGASAHGAPSLKVDHGDTDEIAIQVVASNINADVLDISADSATTANIIDITADALTSGKGIKLESTSNNLGSGGGTNLVDVNATGTSTNPYNIVKIKKQASNLSDSSQIVGLNIEFNGTSGTAGRSLKIDSAQTDGIVAEVDSNQITTGTAMVISGSSLTTGKLLKVTHKDSSTVAVTPTSIAVDFDKSGVAGNSVTQEFRAMHVNMKDVATNNAGSTVRMTGLEIEVDSASDQGTNANVGLSVVVTDATTNDGINITTKDGAGADIKVMSSANPLDFAELTVTGNGVTNFKTVEDGGGSNANLTLDIAGSIDINADSAVTIDGTGASNLTTNGTLTISGSTGLNLKNDSGTIDIETRIGNIDIDSAGAITIDSGTGVIINDDSADSDFRVESNNKTGMIYLDAGNDKLAFGYPNHSEPIDAVVHISASSNTAAFKIESNLGDASGYTSKILQVISGTSELMAINSLGNGKSEVVFNEDSDSSSFAFGINGTTQDGRIRNLITADAGAYFHTNQVKILSGGSPTSPNETNYGDLAFFVSGSIGSKGTSIKGTSVFGGDVVISGSLHGGSPLTIGSEIEITKHGIYKEQASAPTAGSNEAVLYALEDPVDSITKLFTKQSDGTQVGPLGAGGSLDDAYDTPPGGGTKAPGLGAIITVDNQPVQIKVSGASKTALAVTGSVIFGSGSSEFAGHLPVLPGDDTHFFVSGAIGLRGTKGVATFGGDVTMSGSLEINTVAITTDGKVGIGTDNPAYKLSVGGNASFGEYIYHRNNAGGQNTFMRFEDDKISFSAGNEVLLTLTEDTQDVVTVGDGGDVDFTVRSSTDDDANHPALHVQGNTGRLGLGTNAPTSILHIEDAAPTVTIQRQNNANNSTIKFLGAAGATAAMMHLSSSNDLVFKTHDGVDQEEILRLGGHSTIDERRVVFMSGSGMHAAAMQPSQTVDINFFVSGSMMSRSTATKGTAVFGGDLVVSGGIYTGRVTSAEDNNSFIDLGLGNVEISSENLVKVQHKQGEPNTGTDTNFFVSGSIESRNTAVKGTSVFGGDVHISGSLRSEKSLLKHHLIWASGIASEAPRFAASINGGGNATTTPDIENFWSVLGSGSLKALDLWVSEASTAQAGISLFINNDLVPAFHCSGSFVNNNIIGDGNRGHLFIDFSQTQYISGTNSFNPGDLISIGLGKLSGGTFSKIRGTLFYEMDETFLHTNQLGGTLG